jgi:transposase
MTFPELVVRGGNPVARIPFVRHRTVNQIVSKYRACRHPIEKTRWHAIWLLARTDVPRSPDQVADLVGLSGVTVRAVLHRWNADGPAGLTDQRTGNGAAPKLSARRRDALFAALQKRPPDGGVWTGPKVARYVADRWDITVDPTTGWRWLVALGFTLQVPRPAHPKAADAPTRRRWKKTYGGGSAG